jgi:hypothetical protein
MEIAFPAVRRLGVKAKVDSVKATPKPNAKSNKPNPEVSADQCSADGKDKCGSR